MSEHETIQAPSPDRDADTVPHNEIPRPSPLPDFADPAALSAALAEAPPWALAVVYEMNQRQKEFSAGMGEFVNAAAVLERQNREVLANQTSLRRSFDELRSELRSRVGAHDTEFEEVRGRLDTLEQKIEGFIAGPELAAQLEEVQRDLAELRTIVSPRTDPHQG